MSYILDADWIIEALAGRSRAVTTLNRLASEQIATTWVTVAEVYEGAFYSPNPEAHLAAFRDFLGAFRVLNLNEPIVVRFAEIRALLRRRGQIISDFDILLAATALHYDLTVLTFNMRHLNRVPELKVYQPS